MELDGATIAIAAGIAASVGSVAGLAALMLRRRKGARARLYFSMRTDERTDTKHSNEPPPFPRRSDGVNDDE